jgi:hypothetical protein
VFVASWQDKNRIGYAPIRVPLQERKEGNAEWALIADITEIWKPKPSFQRLVFCADSAERPMVGGTSAVEGEKREES